MNIDDCLKTDSIENYLNSRVKRKSGYTQKGGVSKYNRETKTDNENKSEADYDEGKWWFYLWLFWW